MATTIYFYHPNTGKYTGKGLTDYNPRTKTSDLIPAFATTIAPPTIGKNQVAVFKSGAWTTEEVVSEETVKTALTEEQQKEETNASLKYQITVIEEKGIRAMREAVLTGSDESKARLQAIDDQIAELRKSLS